MGPRARGVNHYKAAAVGPRCGHYHNKAKKEENKTHTRREMMRASSSRKAVTREAAGALDIEVHGGVSHDLHDLVVALVGQLARVVHRRLVRLQLRETEQHVCV